MRYPKEFLAKLPPPFVLRHRTKKQIREFIKLLYREWKLRKAVKR